MLSCLSFDNYINCVFSCFIDIKIHFNVESVVQTEKVTLLRHAASNYPSYFLSVSFWSSNVRWPFRVEPDFLHCAPKIESNTTPACLAKNRSGKQPFSFFSWGQTPLIATPFASQEVKECQESVEWPTTSPSRPNSALVFAFHEKVIDDQIWGNLRRLQGVLQGHDPRKLSTARAYTHSLPLTTWLAPKINCKGVNSIAGVAVNSFFMIRIAQEFWQGPPSKGLRVNRHVYGSRAKREMESETPFDEISNDEGGHAPQHSCNSCDFMRIQLLQMFLLHGTQ